MRWRSGPRVMLTVTSQSLKCDTPQKNWAAGAKIYVWEYKKLKIRMNSKKAVVHTAVVVVTAAVVVDIATVVVYCWAYPRYTFGKLKEAFCILNFYQNNTFQVTFETSKKTCNVLWHIEWKPRFPSKKKSARISVNLMTNIFLGWNVRHFAELFNLHGQTNLRIIETEIKSGMSMRSSKSKPWYELLIDLLRSSYCKCNGKLNVTKMYNIDSFSSSFVPLSKQMCIFEKSDCFYTPLTHKSISIPTSE